MGFATSCAGDYIEAVSGARGSGSQSAGPAEMQRSGSSFAQIRRSDRAVPPVRSHYRYPVRHYQVHNRIWEKELLRVPVPYLEVPVPGTVPGYPYLVVRIIRCSRWPGMAGPVTSQGTWYPYPGTRAHFLVPPMGCGSTVPGYR